MSTQAPLVKKLQGFNNKVLCQIWQALSQRYGLPAMKKCMIYTRHWTPEHVHDIYDIRPPIMLSNEKGDIWIDRFYVAFALEGETAWRWAALSYYEMTKEITRIKGEQGTRSTMAAIMCLPQPLRADLLTGYIEMHNTRKALWINPRISSLAAIRKAKA